MAVTVSILKGIKDGNTNQMLEFLENHLNMNISVFSSDYRMLPDPIRKQMGLKSLRAALEYRVKYPLTNSDPSFARALTNAFKIINEQREN